MHPGTARSRVGQGCLTKQQHLLCYHSLWGVRKHSVHGDTPERVVERRDWSPGDDAREGLMTSLG